MANLMAKTEASKRFRAHRRERGASGYYHRLRPRRSAGVYAASPFEGRKATASPALLRRRSGLKARAPMVVSGCASAKASKTPLVNRGTSLLADTEQMLVSTQKHLPLADGRRCKALFPNVIPSHALKLLSRFHYVHDTVVA
jgi:hypothetical protein